MRRKTHFADRYPFSQPAAEPSGRGAWLGFFARRMLIQPASRAAAFGTLAKSGRVRFSDTRQAATGPNSVARVCSANSGRTRESQIAVIAYRC